MAGELLLDTGALVSLLDRSQNQHLNCVTFFRQWEGPVVSSEAILTEAMHLLGSVRGGWTACLDFFLRGAATLVPSTQMSLRRCQELIQKYQDLPMDYADATLVTLAEDLRTNLIFTTDRKDFSVYRIHGRGSFEILPEAS